MKKRLLAVLLTAAMVLEMTACGSKSNSGSSDKKEEAQSADGERKIFCVYGKNSSLIRNRYV